jgi:hypothetical protein
MVIERGDEGKRTERSGKPDPKAKTLAKNPEKKGAAPPEKPTLKATMADTTVQTSESDKKKEKFLAKKLSPR